MPVTLPHGISSFKVTNTGHRQGVTRPTAAILLTGSELLRGVIADRNAAYLAERLESLGFCVRRTLMVGDGRWPTSSGASASWPARP